MMYIVIINLAVGLIVMIHCFDALLCGIAMWYVLLTIVIVTVVQYHAALLNTASYVFPLVNVTHSAIFLTCFVLL